jgi:hypothetical protein
MNKTILDYWSSFPRSRIISLGFRSLPRSPFFCSFVLRVASPLHMTAGPSRGYVVLLVRPACDVYTSDRFNSRVPDLPS